MEVRGKRPVDEKYRKLWLTILDLKKTTEPLAAPAYYSNPVVVFELEPDESVVQREEDGDAAVGTVDCLDEEAGGMPIVTGWIRSQC
ncbi:hypothetical protein WJ35_11380 [Burkholderia ubonensis]|uniref:Uncharacterized protein n=1 Tax=Burkholderia ubonensis TaxID=101571 RepID=A0A1B4LEJ4_9BURK|nr:hypothetical protein WJ35_11380 [Burkholderia ubonensis]AOK08749.1 hypothetical protein WK31_00020 [Burkholderia vietnamiensis]